jgi:hypothetical protein
LVNTDDVEQFFSKKSGIDLQPLFNLYLRTVDKMEIDVKKRPRNEYVISLVNVDMQLPLIIIASEGKKNIIINKKGTIIKSTTLPVIDPDTYYLTKITME